MENAFLQYETVVDKAISSVKKGEIAEAEVDFEVFTETDLPTENGVKEHTLTISLQVRNEIYKPIKNTTHKLEFEGFDKPGGGE